MQVLSQEAPPSRLQEEGALGSAGSRRALAGFFVSGLLIAFLGAILPSWQHHLSSEYETVGYYFVGLIAGIVASVWIPPPPIQHHHTPRTLAFPSPPPPPPFLSLPF